MGEKVGLSGGHQGRQAYGLLLPIDATGVYVHALDARTGQIRWTSDAQGKGPGPGTVPMKLIMPCAG